MKEFIFENWRLIATLLIDIGLLLTTLLVHRQSSNRLTSIEKEKAPVSDLSDRIQLVEEALLKILEVLNKK